MSWAVIMMIIVVILTVVILKLLQKHKIQPTEYPYRKIDILFTPAERSFLGVLNQAVGENVQIFGKVRIADVITPKKGMSRSDWQKAFNKISNKHFDFLLCNKNDLSILCAIELNDRSHNSKKRKDRDIFLEGACQSANVPLVQIVAQTTYNIKEIQNALMVFLPKSMPPKSAGEIETTVIEHKLTDSKKLCPKCSAIMVKKVAKKGKNIGNEFWACSAFPKCRHTEAINMQ
jgi:hypothetical protein